MKRRLPEVRAALAKLDRQQLRRVRRTVDPDLVDFSSNDYLGLARHPDIAAAMGECAQSRGVGSRASHLVTGHGAEHSRLEEELAAFLGRERVLLFSTGYMANLGVMAALADRAETVLLDRLCHASLIDGGLLSGASFRRYAHADAAAAETAMNDSVSVVATDGVFSMDGDVGPLRELSRICSRQEAWLVVDDAHGIGVLGPHGRGTVEHFGLDPDEVPVLVGTLGKAFGVFGAFVAGSFDVIELLMQKARTYIYTTALPQPVAAAARRALEIAERESWRRERVLALSARFRDGARRAGLPLMDSEPVTPIQPVLLGTAEAALRAQVRLMADGFSVVAIRPPTVPPGSARLRVSLSASHTEQQVDALVRALGQVI